MSTEKRPVDSRWFEELPREVEKWLRSAADTPLMFKCRKYDPRAVAEQLFLRDIASIAAMQGMWCALEHAGKNYLRRPDALSDEAADALIEELTLDARKLLKKLERIVPPSSGQDRRQEGQSKAFWRLRSANEKLMREAWKRNGGLPKDGGFLHLGPLVEPETAIPPSIERLLYFSDYLTQVAVAAKRPASETVAGRPRNEKLRHWLEHMSWAWDKHVGKKRTVAFASKSPASDFAKFVWWALELLDPNALPQLPSILVEFRTAGNEAKIN